MVKIFKKEATVFLSMLLLAALLAGAALNVSALEPPPQYDFEPWTGSGSASISIIGDYTKFIKLVIDGEEVSLSNYTVTGVGYNTIITLDEEYLKTLSNGKYCFVAYFSWEIDLFAWEFSIDMQTGEAVVPRESAKISRIFCGQEEVDPSNYNVTIIDENFIIIFEEDYLQTLTGEETFWAILSTECTTTFLYLDVDVQNASLTTTTAIASTTTSINSPKTGDDGTRVTLVIMSMSVISGVVVLLVGRSKKERHITE